MRILDTLRTVLLLLPLAGCVDVDVRIAVKPDGSGTVTERIAMTGPMAQMLRSMESAEGEGFLNREKAQSHAEELGEGVTLQSLEELPESQGMGGVAVYAFEDITRLRMNQNPMDGKEPTAGGKKPATKKPEPQMRFDFDPGPPAVLTVMLDQTRTRKKSGDGGKSRPAPATKPGETKQGETKQGEKADPMAEKMLAGIKEMMKGLRISTSVEVVGNIVETNASYRDGNRITLVELEFDKLLELDPDKASALQPGVDIEAMKDKLANVAGVKIELEREVRVVFNPGTVMATAQVPLPASAPAGSPTQPGR